MKKFTLIAVATLVAVGASAQTYNYFDPKDCDANGWLWFDSQAKLEKYAGFKSDGKDYKITLVSSGFEDAQGNFPEPYLDATAMGYKSVTVDGETTVVEGGEGTWTGAIVLSEGSAKYGLVEGNGGGIYFNLPDCAEFSLAISNNSQFIIATVFGSKSSKDIPDLKLVRGYLKSAFTKPLASTASFQWRNIQDLENNTFTPPLALASPKGQQVTALIRNNQNVPLLVHGIKLFTYTNTTGDSAVGNLDADSNAPVEFYNMQGMKVKGDAPGLYIKRQGSKASKVLVAK